MQYFEPNFVDEALVLLDRFGDGARVVAGATLLGPRLRVDATGVNALVNVKRIPDLLEIHDDGDMLRIGALVTAHALATNPLVLDGAPLLARAASSMGARQLRNVATIGGNVCSHHPAADLAAALLACDARCIVSSLRESAVEIPIEQFLRAEESALSSGDLLVAIDIPKGANAVAYHKMQTRRAFDVAIVAVAVSCSFQARIASDVRIALGGAAPTPIRARAAEAAVAGNELTADAIDHAAHLAAETDAAPASDALASAQYRRHLCAALLRRALFDVSSKPNVAVAAARDRKPR